MLIRMRKSKRSGLYLPEERQCSPETKHIREEWRGLECPYCDYRAVVAADMYDTLLEGHINSAHGKRECIIMQGRNDAQEA